MDHLEELGTALVDGLVECVLAGFDTSMADHLVMHAKGEELRSRSADVALLGPTLFKLAKTLLGEVERKSIPRYAAARQHVRYSRDPLINELEDARATLSAALLKVGDATGGLDRAALLIPIIRVRAVTQAIGAECVTEPARSTAGKRRGPELRRRDIDAADIAPEVADAILDMTRDDGDWDGGMALLQRLEFTSANNTGIVSSLAVLAGQPGGRLYLNKISGRLRRAQFNRPADVPMTQPIPTAPKKAAETPPAVPAAASPTPRDDAPRMSQRYQAAGIVRISPRERLKLSQTAHARDRK